MNQLYNIFIKIIYNIVLPLMGIFNTKINRFQSNRKLLLDKIKNEVKMKKNTVWIHAASLGEYELAIPLIKKIKQKYSSIIILTFFSESGFKLKSRIKEIEHTFYLPIDTQSNAKRFLEVIKPKIAIFIKSEIWPNFLNEIKKRKIKTYLVESRFIKNDRYLTFPLKFLYKNKLKIFHKIFTIDDDSKLELQKSDINNVLVTGSLKVERVKHLLEEEYSNIIIEKFKGEGICIVCGSTWETDEKIIFKYIKKSKNKKLKWIIAPHDTSKGNIKRIEKNIISKYSKFSNITDDNVRGNILILDTIGHLKYIYKYADLCYIGGGMGNTGLHNILEACVFEIPVVIGKNYKKFKESIDLVELRGVVSVKNQFEFDDEFDKLITNEKHRFNIINNSKKYFVGKTGASNTIIKNLTL